jgi:hypothetical protein
MDNADASHGCIYPSSTFGAPKLICVNISGSTISARSVAFGKLSACRTNNSRNANCSGNGRFMKLQTRMPIPYAQQMKSFLSISKILTQVLLIFYCVLQ